MKLFGTQARLARSVVISIVTLAAAAAFAASSPFKDIVTPIEDVKFPALTKLGTSTASGVHLWEDPASGRSSGLVKFTRGSTDKHYHTFDYQLVVVKGVVTHWTDGMPEAAARKLGPGSYWFQPAHGVHQDSCLVDECVMFMNSFAKGETKIVADTLQKK